MMTTSNEHNNAPAVPIQVNDAMAIAFHNALSDGPIDLDEMDDIKTGLNAALANVQAPAPTVPRGEAWGYVDHRGCAIKFKNARHRSELANAIECGGLEYLYTSPAEKLSNDIQSALESLVERCNHDAGMSNEDAVIHAEAVLEHVYNSRSTTPAPAPAVPQGWTKAADQVPLEADGEVFIRFTDGSIGTGWATYWHGASNEFAQWTFPDPDEDRTVLEWTKNPAAPAPAPAQEAQSDPNGWCEYVAGMVFCWLQMQEGLGLTSYDEDRFVEAIAGIVQRRLLAYKPAHPEPVTLTDEAVNDAAKVLAERFDYPWEHMPEEGRKNMRTQVRAVVEAALRAKGGKL